uniref:Uncharacterized protein n=1 Tax=Rhizophora mucronata TaxID=61149 RepID=A0A2P2J3X3_RHIMU
MVKKIRSNSKNHCRHWKKNVILSSKKFNSNRWKTKSSNKEREVKSISIDNKQDSKTRTITRITDALTRALFNRVMRNEPASAGQSLSLDLTELVDDVPPHGKQMETASILDNF